MHFIALRPSGAPLPDPEPFASTLRAAKALHRAWEIGVWREPLAEQFPLSLYQGENRHLGKKGNLMRLDITAQESMDFKKRVPGDFVGHSVVFRAQDASPSGRTAR